MNAIIFLFKCKIRNWFKQLRYNKTKLIMLIFWAVFIGFTLWSSMLGQAAGSAAPQPGDEDFFDTVNFTSTLMIVLWSVMPLFMIVSSMYQGTKRGSSTFSSADVQFIFTGPLRNQSVLTYGMMNSLSSVFISTFFLIYQIPNMRTMGIGAGGFTAFILAWFLIVLIAQLATMTIYLLLFDHQNLAAVVRIVILLMPVVLLLAYVYLLLNGGPAYKWDAQASLYGLLNSWQILLMPVIGWSLSLIAGIFTGMEIVHIVSLGLLLLSMLVMVLYIHKSDADFYEDAMSLTYEREVLLNKQKSGQVKRVKKIRKTGINKGWGADAIFYRQLREYRRSSPFLFTPAVIFYTLATGFVPTILRAAAEDGDFNPADFKGPGVLMILCIVLVIMFWHGMFSSTIAELESNWFYTAPATPLQKLFHSSRLSILKILVDLAPGLTLMVLLLMLNPLILLPFVMAVLSVHLLISGTQLVVYRLIGSIKGTFESMILLLLQGVAMGPTIVIIVVTFVLNAAALLTVTWPSMLLITIVNLGLYAATLPAGVNALEKGLER